MLCYESFLVNKIFYIVLLCERILFIKLGKCSRSYTNIQIRANLPIQDPIYTTGGSLSHGIVMTLS